MPVLQENFWINLHIVKRRASHLVHTVCSGDSFFRIVIKAVLFSKSKNTGTQHFEIAVESESTVGNVDSVRFKLT